eukprot:4582441-Prymnesium_polylepis.1
MKGRGGGGAHECESERGVLICRRRACNSACGGALGCEPQRRVRNAACAAAWLSLRRACTRVWAVGSCSVKATRARVEHYS